MRLVEALVGPNLRLVVLRVQCCDPPPNDGEDQLRRVFVRNNPLASHRFEVKGKPLGLNADIGVKVIRFGNGMGDFVVL